MENKTDTNPFAELGLPVNIVKAVHKLGFEEPTEIQKKVIPEAIEFNPDIIALAHTGTGKTASFALPLIYHVDPALSYTQSIILAPTRELAQQIHLDIKSFLKYTPKIIVEVVYGGTSVQQQVRHLKRNIPHIVVGTPGRVIDLLNRRAIKLDQINHVVLDEADEMLNMGFLDDMNQILSFTPSTKKTWLFSATMPKAVRKITQDYMKKPVEYSISKEQLVNKNIIHQYYSIKVKDKKDTLERIMEMEPEFYGVIFCKTRRKTNELAEQLNADGVPAQALNGELSQAQRDRVMHSFKSKNARILVATDIAARGIDVDSLTHVIHYSLPHDPEYYTHRSGRTARAGKKGFSIALVSPGEVRKYKHMMQQLQLSSEKLDPPLFKEIIAHKIRKWEQDIQTVDDSQISKELGGTEYKVFQDLEKHELVRKLIAYQFSKQWKNAQQEARRHVKPDRFDDREDHSESFDRSRRKNSRGGEVQIFVNIGKMDRITKKSLVAILAKRGGLSAQDMGPIEIHKRHSTFSVSKKLAKSLATRFRGERHRGRKLIVKIDEMT